MRQVLFLFAFLFLISCQKTEITRVEEAAIEKIQELYNGEINSEAAVETFGGNKVRYAHLTVKNSEWLQKYISDSQDNAGNIAYVFYGNLDKRKQLYDEIRVTLHVDTIVQTHQFSVSQLEEIESLEPVLEKTNKYIKTGDYKSLFEQYSDEIEITEARIETIFENLKEEYGPLLELQPYGFRFGNSFEIGDYITIKETIAFEKRTGSIWVTYQRKSKDLVGLYLP